MNNRLEILAAHRALLSSHAAKQRADLSNAFEPLRVPLSYADQGLKTFRFLSRHPVLVSGILAFAVFMMPKHWMTILKSGFMPLGLSLATKYLTKDSTRTAFHPTED